MTARIAIFCAATAGALVCFPRFVHADEPTSEPAPAPAPAETAPAKEPKVEESKDEKPDERRFQPDPRMARLLERRTTLDLDLEGGLGRVFADPAKTIGFGRGRLGVLLVRAPFFESLGVTYEYSGLSPATFGVQGELAWSGGLWGQAGVMLDASGHWGGMAALGYALLGIEGERRDAERTGAAWAVYGKVRLPITVIALALGAAAK